MIGLREEASEAAVRTYDPERALARWRVFEERYGMPFGDEAKARPSGTGRGCRAVVAAGHARSRERVDGVPRAADRELHVARSTSTTPRASATRCARCRASTPIASPPGSTTPRSSRSTSASRREARSAAGTPAEAQDKTATSDGHGALHRAVGRVPPRRGAARRRRLAAAPLLRHACLRTSRPSSSAYRLPNRPSRSSSSSRAG